MKRFIIIFAVFLLLTTITFAQEETDMILHLEKTSRVLHKAAEKVIPSVVHLETRAVKKRSMGRGSTSPETIVEQIQEIGCGVIVSINDRPFVLTNRHVVADVMSNSISLLLADQRRIKVTRVMANLEFDMAVLELEEKDLPVVTIGNSDNVEIVDFVMTIGSPFGLKQSVALGIISGKNRHKIPGGDNPVPLLSLFQTDAAINPGNSGGPLINIRGEVIGIATAIASSSGANEGVGFAIPINDVMRLAKQLIETGKIIRPSLGVDLAPEISSQERENAGLIRQIGVQITAVTANSAASKAELRAGDIVVRYNDVDVENDGHFVRLIAKSNVGDTPTLVVIRGKTPFEAKPTLMGIESR